jgi:hypothetical protein
LIKTTSVANQSTSESWINKLGQLGMAIILVELFT